LGQAAAEFTREFSRGAGRKQLEAEIKRVGDGAPAVDSPTFMVAVFGNGRTPEGHPVLAQAERLGRLLAEAGFDVLSGGYGGTMEAVCRGARQAGSRRVVGVTLDLFTPPLQPNPWLTEERRVRDFIPRLEVLSEADAYVVLRGGIDTLTEATLMWTLLEMGQIKARPLLFVGSEWRRLFEVFRAETFMTDRHLALATIADDVDQAVALLRGALAPAP
jgi:hypothetical protein